MPRSRPRLVATLFAATLALGGGTNARAEETHMHSPGLVAGGTVLTVLGTASAIAATIIFVADSRGGGDFRGLTSVIFGIPLSVNAVGCLAGGIPMIVIGAKDVPNGDIHPTSATATVTWHF